MNLFAFLRGINGRHLLLFCMVAGTIAIAFRLARRARRTAAERAAHLDDLALYD